MRTNQVNGNLLGGRAIPYPLLSNREPTCIKLQSLRTLYSIAVDSIKNAYRYFPLSTRSTPSSLLPTNTLGFASIIVSHIFWYVVTLDPYINIFFLFVILSQSKFTSFLKIFSQRIRSDFNLKHKYEY